MTPAPTDTADSSAPTGSSAASPPPMTYQLLLGVRVAPATTSLTAEQHASAVLRKIHHQIDRGLLSDHEPQAHIERYELMRIWPRT